MNPNAWAEYLAHRKQEGISVVIPSNDHDNWKKLLQDGLIPSDLMVRFSVTSNVILDDTWQHLVVLEPGTPFDRLWTIQGRPIGTHYLPPGTVLIGGPLVVGTSHGDLYFPTHTASCTVAASQGNSVASVTVSRLT